MAAREFLFTSESVTEGHPDKVADQISDTVLDAVLADDPTGRVACETLITTGLVVVAGEITTETYVDIPALVRKKIAEIGYTHSEWGFDAHTCGVVVAIDEQSPDIAQGVDESFERQHDPSDDDPLDLVGAGDQGMMFGYASAETPELMPLPIMLAHKICKRLAEVRKVGELPYLRPDGKAQVTVRYETDEAGRQMPVEIERILVSTQHADGCDAESLIKPDLIERVLHPILPHDLYDEKRFGERDFVYVNPTGKFVIGGPMGDTGLTGRKIIVDTYGGAARHGGGAFSGKDPTKVDRSAAYAARYVAKNVVAAGLAERCEVNVAYAIGVAHPVSIAVRTFGTETIPVDRIRELIREHFDLRPAAILRDLDLQRPIYAKTAAYGHFGRDDHDFTWERTDKADALRAAAGTAAPGYGPRSREQLSGVRTVQSGARDVTSRSSRAEARQEVVERLDGRRAVVACGRRRRRVAVVEVDDQAVTDSVEDVAEDRVRVLLGAPVFGVDVREDGVEPELRDDRELALSGVEARRAEEPRALAEHFLERLDAAEDLGSHLVGRDLRQARVRERVAADLVPFRDDPAHVVRPLADALADQEERREGLVLPKEVERRRRPGGRTVVEGERELHAGRTKSPAAAFSAIVRSSPFRRTVSCSAAGWVSRTSTSVPGTKPWS